MFYGGNNFIDAYILLNMDQATINDTTISIPFWDYEAYMVEQDYILYYIKIFTQILRFYGNEYLKLIDFCYDLGKFIQGIF